MNIMNDPHNILSQMTKAVDDAIAAIDRAVELGNHYNEQGIDMIMESLDAQLAIQREGKRLAQYMKENLA